MIILSALVSLDDRTDENRSSCKQEKAKSKTGDLTYNLVTINTFSARIQPPEL